MNTSSTQKLGSHLASPPYYDDIVALLNKYPTLKYPDDKRYEDYPFQQPTSSRSRVACLEFLDSGLVSHRAFSTLTDLETFLSATPVAGARRLFLLEELQPAYVTILGHRLRIPPTVFSRHRRKALWEYDHNAGNTPPLPSLNDPSTHFAFQYWELVYFHDEIKDFHLRCADNERHIAVTRIDSRFDNVGIVQRKASFWSRPLPSEGWDAILILDGPVKEVLLGSGRTYNRTTMSYSPFQGGYADFIVYPDLESAKVTSGPSRKSLFDDLLYYFSHHSSCLTITTKPASCMLFFKKIMASHFMILSEYYRGVLSHLEWLLSRRETFANLNLDWVEERCSDLHSFNRRCEEYQNDITSVIEQLEIRHESGGGHSNSQVKGDWTSSSRDFENLHSRFAVLKVKSWKLLTSFTNLATIVGNRQSLSEARSVRALTYLGLTFLPLSCVTGLFSMDDSYLPGSAEGGRKFWIPLVFAAVLLLGVFWLSSLTESSLMSGSGYYWWTRWRGKIVQVKSKLCSATSLSTRELRRKLPFLRGSSGMARSEVRGFRKRTPQSPTVDEEKCPPTHDDSG